MFQESHDVGDSGYGVPYNVEEEKIELLEVKDSSGEVIFKVIDDEIVELKSAYINELLSLKVVVW